LQKISDFITKYFCKSSIDEAHNVARRGKGQGASQRAKLAERLSTRSDTLILLSATPHDGRPESFASLMNMLDPTAIASKTTAPSRHFLRELSKLKVLIRQYF
jgi:SNF2 family DNA or RNA helicase